jgi:hypothetical protein
MCTYRIWVIFVIGLFLAGSNKLSFTQESQMQFGQLAPIIVVAQKTPTSKRFLVDSKDVTRDPLRGIAEAYEQHGGDGHYPVVAIVDERLPIRMLGELAGLTGKVGLLNVRYFLLDTDTKKMNEISFGGLFRYPVATK